MSDFTSTAVPGDAPELEIKNLLLLDDDPDLGDALKHLLEARNFVVTVVSNGVEGLHEVMAMDFDVILCDMMMPQMSGDVFYRAVERTKPHLCPRFVFITAHGGDPKVVDFMEKVNGLVVFKPAQTEELLGMIMIALHRAHDED